MKVNYATLLLRGKAGHWWDTICATTPQATIDRLSWEGFVDKLKKEYCSKGDLNQIEREFLTKKKGDSRIEDHVDKFMERLLFLPKMMMKQQLIISLRYSLLSINPLWDKLLILVLLFRLQKESKR